MMENSSALGGTKQIYTNEARGGVEVQEFGWAEEFDIRWSGLIPIYGSVAACDGRFEGWMAIQYVLIA